ncbi:MAG: hypothetical protein IPJ47_22855 [Anaerolineales bacterium]|nr:hypothetical protein [Anaerolineales bacterium]
MTEALYAAIRAYAEGHGGTVNTKPPLTRTSSVADGKGLCSMDYSLAQGYFQLPVRSERPGCVRSQSQVCYQFLYDSIQDLGGNLEHLHTPVSNTLQLKR